MQRKELLYRFTPPSFISNFAPLIVLFSDSDKLHFEYKMWSVLTVVGEFDINLLCKLISEVAENYECEEHIYVCDKQKSIDNSKFLLTCKEYALECNLLSCSSEEDELKALKRLLDILEKE